MSNLESQRLQQTKSLLLTSLKDLIHKRKQFYEKFFFLLERVPVGAVVDYYKSACTRSPERTSTVGSPSLEMTSFQPKNENLP